MTSHASRFVLALTVALLTALTPAAAQPQAPEPPRRYVESLLVGLSKRDLGIFTKFASNEFKARFTPQLFDTWAEKYSRRVRGGYVLQYAGKMRQADFPIYLYIIKFQDGGDDHLIMVTLHDQEIAGVVMF